MKKYLKVFFVVAVATVAGYNVYQSQFVMNGLSEMALANVEALASGEYDYVVAGCIKDCGNSYSGVCTTKATNGAVGVKCDHAASGKKDCCGVKSEQGSVG